MKKINNQIRKVLLKVALRLKLISASAKRETSSKDGLIRVEPDSSAIKWLAYNQGSNELTVCFKRNSSCYKYNWVSAKLFREFASAESCGQFFTKEIRSNFTGHLVA